MNQSASLSSIDLGESPGRDLLHLLRRCDKLLKGAEVDAQSEKEQTHQDILNLLQSLDTSIQRTGLLSPTAVSKIQSLTDSNTINTNNEGGGGGKKRKRKGGDRANATTATQYGIYLDGHAENGDKVDLEEGRVVMGLCRALGAGKKSKSDDEHVDGDGAEVIGAACQVLTSICRHAINSSGVSSPVVKDMIGAINAPLLNGLMDLMSTLQEASAASTLVSVLKAAASVISLVQTRCTNSKAGETIMQNLRTAAWSVLNSTNDQDVAKASAGLLATLPLAGDASNNALSTLWTKSLNEGILLLQYAISDVFPVNENDKGGSLKDPATDSIRQDHQTWLQSLKSSVDKSADNDTIDADRRDRFASRVQSLTEYITSLIKLKDFSINQGSNVFFVNLPLQALLDTSETLLSFPLAAEIKHRSLSSRLRSSPVDGGLISANAAIAIASSMRYCGHLVFETGVSACRGGAYSKARRIIAISMANLQSSVSRGLLSVVVEGRKVDGRRDGISAQLRGSIPLRIKSVEMFRTVVMALGSGAMSSGTSKSVCRGVVLVGGCLLEQMQRCCGGVEDGVAVEEEWGTFEERGTLIETCSSTLASCIATFGGLIPNNVRGTIDSITHTCISTLYSVGSSSVLAYSEVKKSLLRLGMNSVCMPWGDGGRSTLLGIVRTAASVLRSDSDNSVAAAAMSTMCALDGVITPRAPALMVPSRETVSDNPNAMSSGDIIDGIKAAAVEMTTAKEKEKKSSKRKKTDEKKQKNKATNASTEDSSLNNVPPPTTSKDKLERRNDEKEQQKPDITAAVNMDVVMDDKSKDAKEDISAGENGVIPMELGTDDKPANVVAAAKEPIVTPAAATTEKLSENDEESGDDSSSMGDFPDIVDEDPDEEDRV